MGKRVLVVDDEKLIVKGIRFSLEQDGMKADAAYDGEEALKLAQENTLYSRPHHTQAPVSYPYPRLSPST